jgi:hypothetical protein
MWPFAWHTDGHDGTSMYSVQYVRRNVNMHAVAFAGLVGVSSKIGTKIQSKKGTGNRTPIHQAIII